MKYTLYHGSSSFLSLEAVHAHIEEIKEKEPSITLNIVEASSVQDHNIIDLLTSNSLFSSKRILLLKRTYRNKSKDVLIENILQILEQKRGDDYIILWEDQKIRSNTKYYKFFKKNNSVKEIAELNKRTFLTWLRGRLESYQLKIEPSVVKELAERTNYDPERCSNEIEKFKLNNLDKIISKEDVQALTTNTLEREIWDLTDAINQQDKEKSISILEKLSFQNTDPNYILSMLARNLRLIYLTKHLAEKGLDYRRISSSLKIPPFTTPSLMRASSKYSVDRIKLLYSKLSNLDFQIKSGRIDPNLGLTLICPFL